MICKKFFSLTLICISALCLSGCYSLSDFNLEPEIKTFEVSYFPVNINTNSLNSVYNATLGQDIQTQLQEYMQRRSPLNLTDKGGDIAFEGEITSYQLSPIAAVSGDENAQTRISLTVKVSYFNTYNKEKNFSKNYTEFQDFDRNSLYSDVEDGLLEIMLDQMFQKIFNDSVGNW